MWMDGLVRICVVCLAAVNTAAINTGCYPSGHFRLPTTCSCQLIVNAVSTDTMFSVGRFSAKAAAARYLDEDVHIPLHIFLDQNLHLYPYLDSLQCNVFRWTPLWCGQLMFSET